MSKQLHRSFRKVLQVQNSSQEYNGISIPVKTVLWCIPDAITSRTVKTNHIGITIYFGGTRHSGVRAWMPSKSVSLNLKNPLASKFFETVNLKYYMNEAGSNAYRSFILGDKSRCEGLTGLVTWFNGEEGFIRVNGQLYPVYACNIKGAKTWYLETACMFLVAGETVTVDLRDMGDHLTCRVTTGGHFDAAKWDSLDQTKLAFRCDDEGKALNGLFA